jgi:hypothetical protein
MKEVTIRPGLKYQRPFDWERNQVRYEQIENGQADF